jgi:hypothetical protein
MTSLLFNSQVTEESNDYTCRRIRPIPPRDRAIFVELPSVLSVLL